MAKYNAFILAATQLYHQCDSKVTLHQFHEDDLFLEDVNNEIAKIVKSLLKRASNLNLKYHGLLPDYVAESQNPDQELKDVLC